METKELDTLTQVHIDSESELLYRTRSEEVQEIIGRMPSWIIRWGITVIGMVVLGAFIVAALMRSPDVVNCNATIAPAELPVIIRVSENRQIQKLLVKEGELVDKGRPLAVLDHPMTDYMAILEAKSIAQAIDTSLYLKQVLGKLPEKKHVFPAQLQNAYMELMISAKHYLYASPLKDEDYQWQQEVRLNAGKLMTLCSAWEQQYLLLSVSAGRIHFLRTLHDETHLSANEAIIAIVKPGNRNAIIVKGNIPVAAHANVKPGQTVLLTLNDYSAQEFGMLKAKVSMCSEVPVDGLYAIEMTLSSGLVTTTGREIPGQSALNATAEIVLQDKSLLQKLFEKY